MDLFDHQKEIIEADPKWALFALGTGSGKTRIELELAEGTTLVICPKQQKLDKTFERNQEKFGISLYVKVMSKEEFRRDWEKLPRFDTIIVDEAHTMFGVLPDTKQVKGVSTPKTSQLFDALLKYTRRHPPTRFYMGTATPASKPMNVWAIGTLFGKKWDFFAFREKYYIAKKIGYRTLWLPRNSQELKDRLAQVIKNFGYTGQLADWFEVPDQTHKVVYCNLSTDQIEAIKALRTTEADPMAIRARTRTIENGILYSVDVIDQPNGSQSMVKRIHFYKNEKMDILLEYAQKIPKLLIFANYTGQIIAIAKNLANAGYEVLTLTGATKDRANILQLAESEPRVIVVAQASICEGYEFKSCNTVIFASKSNRYLHYNQGMGRVLRADAIKKNLYIHLVVKGGMDEACHKAIEIGNDFQEKIMANED